MDKTMGTKPAPLDVGQTYHIFNRGVNRQAIFFEARNYQYFLQLYARHIAPIADTFAYCLMQNHFHLLVRIRDEEQRRVAHTRTRSNPSQAFGNLFNAYAKAINKHYQRTGSLFEHPFHRVAVTSDAYFARLVTYIHRNPQRHGFVGDFRHYPYSSYQALLADKPSLLCQAAVLDWFGGRERFDVLHSDAHHTPDLPNDILEFLEGLERPEEF